MLNKAYWENRYQNKNTGWDVGYAAPALTEYCDQLTSKDLSILIPGAGYGHEMAYLLKNGFTNVTVVDLSKSALLQLKSQLPDVDESHFIEGDFFDLEGNFDLILEQTFFCALDPQLRASYVMQSARLLKPFGKIAGVLFDFPLTEKGPPYGGSKTEYQELFKPTFHLKKIERCRNSIKPRQGNELFFIFENKQQSAK